MHTRSLLLALSLVLTACGSPFAERIAPPSDSGVPDSAEDALGPSEPRPDARKDVGGDEAAPDGGSLEGSPDALGAPDSGGVEAGPDANPCPGGGSLALCGTAPYCAGPSYCVWDELSGVYVIASAPGSCASCACLLALPSSCYGAHGGACAPDPTGGGCAAIVGCSEASGAPVMTCCGGIGCP